MQSIVDACRDGAIDGEVVLVAGNFAESPALERARSLGIETAVVASPKSGSEQATEQEYGRRLLDVLRAANPGLICLAGYIRKLPESLVQAFPERIMNMHNALLPAFGGKGMYGMRVHEAVVATGVRYSGCTVHFADGEYDNGPIILQSIVPVYDDDTPDDVAARVLIEEHKLFPQAVALFAEGRLKIEGRRVRILPKG
jgi:formyltetrahydrofolate-dependent phosphoribosylglycinamide formyltransferase